MKKTGFVIFTVALTLGLLSAMNCSYGNMVGVQGSGNIKTEKRELVNFTKIEAGGAINLEVVAQNDFSVEVSADDNLLSLITTEVSDNTLKIATKDRISPKNRITVTISLPEINKLDVFGASTANVANVKSDSIELQATGASKIIIDGAAQTLNSIASGASNIDAEKLQVEEATVEASGASKTTVSALNQLNAESSGTSSIYYTGEPKSIQPKISGASSIEKK